jgi:hypothetical protein
MKDSTFCVACGGVDGDHTTRCDRDTAIITSTPERVAAALVSAFRLNIGANLHGRDGKRCTEAMMTAFAISEASAEEYLLRSAVRMRGEPADEPV